MPSPMAVPPDLTSCDREPIHIPGSIQPHGMLFASQGPDLRITTVSANSDRFIRRPPSDVLGRPLAEVLGADIARMVAAQPESRQPLYLKTIEVNGQPFRAIVHNIPAHTLLELEAASSDSAITFAELYPRVSQFVNRLQDASDTLELGALAAEEFRKLTNFDRVMIYRFDADWHGEVIAEDRNDRLPSYLGLRFPASDIPAQARELYRVNRMRLIADAGYEPVPLLAEGASDPLDLSFAVLRSVSPVHIEYMRNMGTLSSMSVSIVRDNRLWGLISFHHSEPKQPGFEVRTVCDMAAQVFAQRLSAAERAQQYERRLHLKSIHGRLLAYMAREAGFVDGLVSHPQELCGLTESAGAAVLVGGECHLIGQSPDEEQVRALADWIAGSGGHEVYSTDELPTVFAAAKQYVAVASGLLAIEISKLHRSYVLWFRPEVIRTVNWGGDPRKPADGDVRLHPRKSFDLWRETLRCKSRPWDEAEIEAAADLRNSIVGIVLRKAEELAQVTEELERSNRELEAFSYSVSHDLRAPFRHIVGFSELLRESENGRLSADGKRYIQTILESARFAGKLVDNLLTFSHIGRSTLTRVPIDMNSVVRDVKMKLKSETGDRKVTWSVAPLPNVEGDPLLLRLVVENLLSNAVKFTSTREEAVIEVGSRDAGDELIFWVRDNGVGFEMAYVDKLFGVFQRLHRAEEFEGTGIGLANVRRIVSRHGGRTWAEGAVNEGAAIFFTLPPPGQREAV